MMMDGGHSNSEATRAIADYFRCPKGCVEIGLDGELGATARFFRLGPELTCFGRTTRAVAGVANNGDAPDLSAIVRTEASRCLLPFDPAEAAANLRWERYLDGGQANGQKSALGKLKRNAYYAVRPLLSVSIRKHLQRASLKGWEKKLFPRWPVDSSVDRMFQRVLAWQLRGRGTKRMPFIWFWPKGMKSCLIMTHDVEEKAGLEFCPELMETDHSFGIKSSFQIVPEQRYRIPDDLVTRLRNEGFEVNVQDMNHDGHLYDDRNEFRRRATRINGYIRELGARGFRSGALYRNLEWYSEFEFSYDMSVPNVGHLDAQLGGCCTVMPYFVGRILELPVTTIQDYSLFNVIGDYSIDLWKKQITSIADGNGLISFIVHPDYIIEPRAHATYRALLEHLTRFRSECNVWFALPGDVDRWWRERSRMNIVTGPDGRLRIEGPDSERARIAWARVAGEGLTYSFDGEQ